MTQSNPSPRILLTGASGFIGSHLCDRFLAEGAEVIGVDNFITGRPSNIAHLKEHPRFRLIEADASLPLGDQVQGKLDWILHFASPASPPKYLAAPVETLRINSEGTRFLLELARERGASFFFASTSEVYGDPEVHPQPESYWGHVNPIGIRSVYDEAKRYGEAMTFSFHRQFGLPIRVIRIFNTYGPRMDPEDGRVVSNLICQALRGEDLTIYGEGKQTRSFQYVSDLVEGIWRLMQTPYFEPVNLGNPEEYTVLQLAELVREAVLEPKAGRRELAIRFLPLPSDDPKQRRPVITRAREVLGWSPRVPVREGLQRTVEYFRSELAR